MTTEFAEHPSSEEVSPVVQTWEAAEVSPVQETWEPGSDHEPGPEVTAVVPKSPAEPWRLQHLMMLVAGVAVFLWLVVTLGGLVVAGGFVLLFASAIGAGFIWARLRVTRQDSLVWILAIATERGIPLAPAVAAFADQYRGKARRRVVQLVDQLNAGTSLPEAFEQTPRAVSRDVTLMAWIGQVTGLMSKALRLAGSARSASLSLWMSIASRVAYVLGLLLAMQTIVGFIFYFIIPKFEAIFRDFGISLPEVTVFVIQVAHLMMVYSPISSLFVLGEIICFFYVPFSFAGWMNYNLPIFDRMFTRRHTALVLRALSLVVEANQPIALGLATLAEHYPTRWVRRRLVKVERAVRQGADWIDALWRVGIIRSADAEVLASAATVGNLAWALRELAETSERRQAIRIQAVVQTLFPVAVILFGMVVAIMVIAYFVPLIKIIGELTRT
ncbi:MAG TPA: type II secretion system F family protein [Isosphaeraceae bacterium]|nr:type II secretion system F family protein [Isosphaeraceae bacterium]